MTTMKATECLALLREQRWCDGFKCPDCGHTKGYQLRTRDVIECAKCKKQVSPTSGTAMHKIRRKNLPIVMEFVANASSGQPASALRIAKESKYRYETVWRIGHKVRKCFSDQFQSVTFSIDYHLLAGALTKQSKETMEELVREQIDESEGQETAFIQAEIEQRAIPPPEFTPVAKQELELWQASKALKTERGDYLQEPGEITSIQIIEPEGLSVAPQMVQLFRLTFTGVSFKYVQNYVWEFCMSRLSDNRLTDLVQKCLSAKHWWPVNSYRSPVQLKAFRTMPLLS